MRKELKIKSETGEENQSEKLTYVTLVHETEKQSWEKNWEEGKEIKKIKQDQKSLISTFM